MRSGAGEAARKRSWRVSAKLLVLSSIVTVVGFSAVCALVLLDMRRSDETLALQTAQNLATTIDADIARNIELYDLSLRAVVSNLASPEIANVSKPLLQLILFDNAATARYFGPIEVLNPAGRVQIDSSTLDPEPLDRSDEEYFRVPRDHPDVGLFISRPQLYRGAYSIVLSRRIVGKDGTFLGVVAGSIRFSYFHSLFGGLQLQADDRISVLRHDGVIVMRTPFDLDVIGRDISGSPGVQKALTTRRGSISAQSAVDGIDRLFVWSETEHPLVVMVGKSWDSIFDRWRREAAQIGAMMLILIAFVITATVFLAREIGQRARAERKLQQLAITDALTGLSNRRRFDEAIDLEWRRGVRQQTAVALLMIDADRFKAYNDSHGHQAGDEVLSGIAACIAGSVRRAGECAARYGGEEFAVLLPGRSTAEAVQIAEAIRLQVESIEFPNGRVTVSIGVACLSPFVGAEWSDLVAGADRALYGAKAGGRNRTFVATHHLAAAA